MDRLGEGIDFELELEEISPGWVFALIDRVLGRSWHVVVESRRLEPGKLVAARVLGEDLVAWRAADGAPRVWQDLCQHRGARLSLGWIENGMVVCPYHGWTYDAGGQCVRFPAHPEVTPPKRARVKAYAAREKYGFVWVRLDEAGDGADIPVFPEWGDPGFRKIRCGPYFYRASAPRALENFLDVAHFAYVHAGLLGDPTRPEIGDYEVREVDGVLEATNVRVWQPNPDGSGRAKLVEYTYRVLAPLTAYFSKRSDEGVFSMFFAVTPITQTECVAYAWIALNYMHDVPDEEIRRFQDRVTGQDIPIVESQRPELLPLDLQAELHMRADRLSIAYRKWLKRLGVSFGTA